MAQILDGSRCVTSVRPRLNLKGVRRSNGLKGAAAEPQGTAVMGAGIPHPPAVR